MSSQSAVLSIPQRIGESTIEIATKVGGIAIMALQIFRRMRPSSVDRFELIRNMYRMGVKSVPIVSATAIFTGAIMVITATPIVMQFNAKNFVGWSATFTSLREIGPLLIGIMFNGRVGANNTAELGTMVVTEQIDALRALAIDPIAYLVVPRVIAIVSVMTLLVVVGDMLSLIGSMGMAWLLMDIHPQAFYTSTVPMIEPWDFYVGVVKAFLFGIMISLNSCYFGLSTKGGASGVGRAVNDSVVAAASGIFIADYLSTFILG